MGDFLLIWVPVLVMARPNENQQLVPGKDQADPCLPHQPVSMYALSCLLAYEIYLPQMA